METRINVIFALVALLALTCTIAIAADYKTDAAATRAKLEALETATERAERLNAEERKQQAEEMRRLTAQVDYFITGGWK